MQKLHELVHVGVRRLQSDNIIKGCLVSQCTQPLYAARTPLIQFCRSDIHLRRGSLLSVHGSFSA